MTLLQVEGVSKLFGRGSQEALDMVRAGESRDAIKRATGEVLGVGDVSFDVAEGEIVVVMGLSGSGKSTIIRCLNRLIEPTAGCVSIAGEDILAYDAHALRRLRRSRIGMVFQRFALFPHRPVADNAAYGLEINGVPREERLRRAEEVLGLVGLDGWGGKYPHELSGGMQQRVGLARALAADPDIILMDEAFSALDPLIRKDMQGEALRLQRKLGKTIVFITHDLDEPITPSPKRAGCFLNSPRFPSAATSPTCDCTCAGWRSPFASNPVPGQDVEPLSGPGSLVLRERTGPNLTGPSNLPGQVGCEPVILTWTSSRAP